MSDLLDLRPQRRLALTMLVMMATFIQVLDTTIANVVLPHMQASLGATPESIAWVLTSYIVASAVAMPVTGWLEGRIGRRTLLLVAVGGFTIASTLCGIAATLPAMVGARVLQGLFGAFLVPLSQAVLLDLYPPHQRAKALTIWGLGVMVAPIVGPILGGWLTEAYDWRWVFFINAPVGVVALAGMWALMPDIRPRPEPFDMIGFGLLTLALASLQLALDRGTQLDWFDSPEIMIEFGIFIATAWMFGVHTMTAPNPLFPRAVLRDRNFLLANLFMLSGFGIMMAGAALVPPMLQTLFGYDTIEAGWMMVPRGIGMVPGMLLVGRLAGKVDIRWVVGAGTVLTVAAQFIMAKFSLDMGHELLILSAAVQGLGLGLALMPMNIIAFSTIPTELRTSAASVYNLTRNIGGSVAIAAFSALFARNLQLNHAELAAHIAETRFPELALGSHFPSGTAVLMMLDHEINRQAAMIAYVDDFLLMGLLIAAVLPFTILFNSLKGSHRAAHDEPMALE